MEMDMIWLYFLSFKLIRNVGLEMRWDIQTNKFFHKYVRYLLWKLLLDLWSIFTLIWEKGKWFSTPVHMSIFIAAEQQRKLFLILLLILLPSPTPLPPPLLLVLLTKTTTIIIIIIHIVIVKSSHCRLVFDN